MIYDSYVLKSKYKDYSNINQKIAIDCKNGVFQRVKRGLYSTNVAVDGPVLANVCQSPSYLSFEYALSVYGLIPEYVSVYTSAVYRKKNNRSHWTQGAKFEYLRIPDAAFPYGITYMENEEGVRYKIASKEKALMDLIYTKYPVRSIKDIKMMLFDDLRIDEEELRKLDFSFIKEVAPFYHSNSINSLIKFINRCSKAEV